MPRLTNIVKDRRTMLTETRMQPAPEYETAILNAPTIAYTARRDQEFMYKEMLLRLNNHIKSKLNPDQIDQLYLEIADDNVLKKLPLIDFQNTIIESSDGDYLIKDPLSMDTVEKITGWLEQNLPQDQLDEISNDLDSIVPMESEEYPEEEKYINPVKAELDDILAHLPADQQTEETYDLLADVENDTKVISKKYFAYLQTMNKELVQGNKVSGMEIYADHAMYAATDNFLKSFENGKYTDPSMVSPGTSSYYHTRYLFDEVTGKFISDIPHLVTLETGISDETLSDITSVINDMNSLGPDGYDYPNYVLPDKPDLPLSEFGNKHYGLLASGKALQNLHDAVKAKDIEKIKAAHERYKEVQGTTRRMLETAKTHPEKGQADLLEGNLDALRGTTITVPPENLTDFVAHSKLASTLMFKVLCDTQKLDPVETLKKPEAAAKKMSDRYVVKYGLDSFGSPAKKLAKALSGESAGTFSRDFARTIGGCLQRGIEGVAGYARSKEEREAIVGHAQLAQGVAYGIEKEHCRAWENIANAKGDKRDRVQQLSILIPAEELSLANIGAKLDNKDWDRDLSVERQISRLSKEGKLDYNGIIDKANSMLDEAWEESQRISEEDDELPGFNKDSFKMSTARLYNKLLLAAPQEVKNTEGYRRMQSEYEKIAIETTETAQTDFLQKYDTLNARKSGLFLSSTNSPEHTAMMNKLKLLKDKMTLIKGAENDFSEEYKEQLKQKPLKELIHEARDATFKYSIHAEDYGKKSKFRHDTGLDRANAATDVLRDLDDIADTVDGRTPVEKAADQVRYDTMYNRKDAESVENNAAKALYVSYIASNPEKYNPRRQHLMLEDDKMKKAIDEIKKDAAFKEMMKSQGRSKMADKIIRGEFDVTTAYLDAQKKIDPTSIGKKGSEMTVEEKKEFMKNARIKGVEEPKEKVPMFQ